MALWVKQNPTAGCCGNNWPAKNEGRGLEGRGCQDSDSIISLTFLCLFTLLSGCFLGNPVQLRQTESGRTIEIETHDTLKIVLEGNPTTGYLWKTEPWDTSIIEQTGEPVYKPKSNAIGSGGEYTFHFKALSPGQTVLRFIYLRSFERDVPPLKSFEVKVVVS